jgi:phosphoribosylformylglycinamidine synthase I
MKPTTLIIRTAGTNCDAELAHAFELAGATVLAIHLNLLIEQPELLERFDLLGLPGGFSYGDDIASGKIFATRLRLRLYPALRRFIADGRPVIGICNGFQLLTKAGFLPGFDLPEDRPPTQVATLADNTSARFQDRWITVKAGSPSVCIWTRGMDECDLPIAHGEGRFFAPSQVLDRMQANGQVALRYTDNPNGSLRDIAGVCDPTGLVFGLMPHPERFTHITQHPRWTRGGVASPAGLKFFTNAVQYVTERAAAAAPGA